MCVVEQLFEKYHAQLVGHPGGGGEYIVQDGFGWTNGVILWMLERYGDALRVPDECPVSLAAIETPSGESFGEIAFRRYEMLQRIQRWVDNHLVLSLLVILVAALTALYFISLFRAGKGSSSLQSRSGILIGSESATVLIPLYLSDDPATISSIYPR